MDNAIAPSIGGGIFQTIRGLPKLGLNVRGESLVAALF